MIQDVTRRHLQLPGQFVECFDDSFVERSLIHVTIISTGGETASVHDAAGFSPSSVRAFVASSPAQKWRQTGTRFQNSIALKQITDIALWQSVPLEPGRALIQEGFDRLEMIQSIVAHALKCRAEVKVVRQVQPLRRLQ